MYFNYVMIPLASWGAKKPFTGFSMPVLLGMSVQFKQSDTNAFHLHAHQQVVKALMSINFKLYSVMSVECKRGHKTLQ